MGIPDLGLVGRVKFYMEFTFVGVGIANSDADVKGYDMDLEDRPVGGVDRNWRVGEEFFKAIDKGMEIGEGYVHQEKGRN